MDQTYWSPNTGAAPAGNLTLNSFTVIWGFLKNFSNSPFLSSTLILLFTEVESSTFLYSL
jgi:hypothetical protein